MDGLARVAGGRRGRILWIGVALVCALGIGATFMLASSASDRALDEASARAKRYAETVLFRNLDPKLAEQQILGPLYRQGAILGPKYRELLIAVQDAILVDPNVTTVRIWDRTGLLIFSTDRGDRIGSRRSAPAALDTALQGKTTNTLSGDVLLTVTPLRIPGQLNTSAVAAIEQDAAAIRAGAAAGWMPVRAAAAVAILVCIGFAVVSTVRPEPPAKQQPAAAPAPGSSGDAERIRGELTAVRRDLDDAAARVRAAEAERDSARAAAADALEMAEAAKADAVAARADAEAAKADAAARASEPAVAPDPAEWMTEDLTRERQRAHALERDLAAAASGAEAAEARATELEARLHVSEERVRELEKLMPSLAIAPHEHGADAPSEEDLREYEFTLRTAAVRELRGPVSRVRGVALALKEEVSTAKGKDLVDRLSTAASRVDRIAADLESLGRLVDGTLPLRRWATELERFVERVVMEWQRETERVVTVEAQAVAVPVDQSRLQQVLDSLLDDASERSDPAQPMIVRVLPHAEGAVIAVEAAGELTPRADLQLAVARRLVELHGGRIWYEPRTEGSAVLVLFPSDRPAEHVAGATG